jgi:cell division protein FtsB
MTLRASIGRMRHSGALVAVVLASIVVLIALAILPVRSWTTQKQATQQTLEELARVQGEVAELQAKLDLLQTDDEVERMARENFDLVFPGEESYRILPAPEAD